MSDHHDSISPEPVTVLILAGGRGGRMGDQPKWRLPWGRSTLLEHIVAEARSFARETLVVGGEGIEAPAGAEWVPDIYRECGPLGGLHAGLSAARFEWCIALGCDMPFVRPQAMRGLLALAAGYDAAVPRAADGCHPLFAAYSRSCAPTIERKLRGGARRMLWFLDDVRVRWVAEEELRQLDPDLRCLFNINTWADYERARELARLAVTR
jgi:molybdopterin-guanine dinucleotide biosynthesis protein A